MQATTLRLQGNSAARDGLFDEAIEAYDAALTLDIPQGRHLALSNKAGVLLSLGRNEEALKTAEDAVAASPPGFNNSLFRQVRFFWAFSWRLFCNKKLQSDLGIGYAQWPDPSLKVQATATSGRFLRNQVALNHNIQLGNLKFSMGEGDLFTGYQLKWQ